MNYGGDGVGGGRGGGGVNQLENFQLVLSLRNMSIYGTVILPSEMAFAGQRWVFAQSFVLSWACIRSLSWRCAQSSGQESVQFH